jgi:hypothetical protein
MFFRAEIALMMRPCFPILFKRYQPTTDKVMRLHAQTALIENCFVRIPEDAPWLAEYLHELTVFPKGKHDDQADSTAQFLDWYKNPGPNDGYFEWLRMEAEAIRGPQKVRKRVRVLLKGPPYMQVQTLSNRHLEVSPDGTIELSAEDACCAANRIRTARQSG